MLTSQLLISALLLVWGYVLWSRRRIYQLMLQMPGPIGYPLLGILPRLWGKNAFLTEFTSILQQYGSTVFCWFGPLPILYVADPQIAQDVLTSAHSINKAYIAYSVLQQIIGNGIVVIKDPVWSAHRKALNPAFGHNIILSFLPIFNKEAELLVQEFDTLVDNGEHYLFTILKNFTLRITTQTTMGGDVTNEECYKNNSIMNNYNSLHISGTKLVISPWLDNRLMKYLSGIGEAINTENAKCRKLIKKFIDKNLESKAKNNRLIEQTNLEKNIFINIATEFLRKGIFSYQDVEDESHTFVLAGFETSAITLGCTLMLLAMFPEYQERAFEEIKSMFPNTGDFDVTYEDTQKLEYLNMVINESMRLMPVFPQVARKINQDVKLSNGVVLPKGLDIALGIYHIHRNKDTWGPDANMFNPENCSPESLRNKHPYAYMPFSKGKRNCIGWKYGLLVLNVTLTKCLRNHKFSTSFRYEDLDINNNVNLDYKQMPCLKIEKRV